jgi:hypothetical protein
LESKRRKQAKQSQGSEDQVFAIASRKRWTATSEKPRTGDRQKSGSLAFEKKEENHPIYSKAIQKGSRERERKRIQKGSRERERNPVRLELSLDARHSRLSCTSPFKLLSDASLTFLKFLACGNKASN